MNDGIRKCNDVKVTERLIYINPGWQNYTKSRNWQNFMQ